MPRARTQSGSDNCAATVTELATVIHASPPTNIEGDAVHTVGDIATPTVASAWTTDP